MQLFQLHHRHAYEPCARQLITASINGGVCYIFPRLAYPFSFLFLLLRDFRSRNTIDFAWIDILLSLSANRFASRLLR